VFVCCPDEPGVRCRAELDSHPCRQPFGSLNTRGGSHAVFSRVYQILAVHGCLTWKGEDRHELTSQPTPVRVPRPPARRLPFPPDTSIPTTSGSCVLRSKGSPLGATWPSAARRRCHRG